MKKPLAALIALAALVAALAAGQAEGPVLVDHDVEVVFAIADFDEGWAEATGEAPSEDAEHCRRYYLRVRLAKDDADYTLERFTRRLGTWRLQTGSGQIYLLQSARAESADGEPLEVGAFFALDGEKSRGRTEANRLTVTIEGHPNKLGWALYDVPMSADEARAEPTPVPEATPEEVARLREICLKARQAIGADLEGEGEYPGKLVFAVYQKDIDESPVFSNVHGAFFGEVPAERLAANLEEADTAVVIWPEYKSVGMYSSGSFAFRCTTRVGVYDLNSDRLMYTYTYSVEEPPRKVSDSDSHSGRYKAYEASGEIGKRLTAGQEP